MTGRQQPLHASQSLKAVIMDVGVDESRERLAQVVRTEHAAAIEAATQVIEHMIRAGDALWEIRKTFPTRGKPGQPGWQDWCLANLDVSLSSIGYYMRFSRFADLLRKEGVQDVRAARRAIAREHGDLRITPHNDPVVVKEAKRLHDEEGWSGLQIAAHLSIPKSTVYTWIHPQQAKRRQQRARLITREGRRAVNQRERDAVVRRKGGQAAAAYAHVRKALEALQHALEAEGEAEARAAIHSAMNRLYGVEDQIVTAAKIGRKRDVA